MSGIEQYVGDGDAEGVLLAQAGDAGGYVFYLADGRPCHVYNYVGLDRFAVQAPDQLSPGRHALRYEFEPTGAPDIAHGKGAPGRGQLWASSGG